MASLQKVAIHARIIFGMLSIPSLVHRSIHYNFTLQVHFRLFAEIFGLVLELRRLGRRQLILANNLLLHLPSFLVCYFILHFKLLS